MFFEGSFLQIQFNMARDKFYRAPWQQLGAGADALADEFENLWDNAENDNERRWLASSFAGVVMATVEDIKTQRTLDTVELLRDAATRMFDRLDVKARDYLVETDMPPLLKQEARTLQARAERQKDDGIRFALQNVADSVEMMASVLYPAPAQPQQQPQPRAALLGKKPRHFDI